MLRPPGQPASGPGPGLMKAGSRELSSGPAARPGPGKDARPGHELVRTLQAESGGSKLGGRSRPAGRRGSAPRGGSLRGRRGGLSSLQPLRPLSGPHCQHGSRRPPVPFRKPSCVVSSGLTQASWLLNPAPHGHSIAQTCVIRWAHSASEPGQRAAISPASRGLQGPPLRTVLGLRGRVSPSELSAGAQQARARLH